MTTNKPASCSELHQIAGKGATIVCSLCGETIGFSPDLTIEEANMIEQGLREFANLHIRMALASTDTLERRIRCEFANRFDMLADRIEEAARKS